MLQEVQLRKVVQHKAVVKAERAAALKAAKIAMIKAKRQDVVQQKIEKQVYIQSIEKGREHEKDRAHKMKEGIRQRELKMLQRKHKQKVLCVLLCEPTGLAGVCRISCADSIRDST
mmetsp:Transcript_13902/g.32885  ORF Transcript_13902/g.32885 Transcript_13902/m.32885 type:complete len:116 (-) Transcript_13902:207-554(-)